MRFPLRRNESFGCLAVALHHKAPRLRRWANPPRIIRQMQYRVGSVGHIADILVVEDVQSADQGINHYVEITDDFKQPSDSRFILFVPLLDFTTQNAPTRVRSVNLVPLLNILPIHAQAKARLDPIAHSQEVFEILSREPVLE